MSVAAHLPEQERQRQIRRACIYTFVLCSSFLVAGSLIMSFFGISIPGMRIAGGMIVAFLGFGMLFPDPRDASHKAPQSCLFHQMLWQSLFHQATIQLIERDWCALSA